MRGTSRGRSHKHTRQRLAPKLEPRQIKQTRRQSNEKYIPIALGALVATIGALVALKVVRSRRRSNTNHATKQPENKITNEIAQPQLQSQFQTKDIFELKTEEILPEIDSGLNFDVKNLEKFIAEQKVVDEVTDKVTEVTEVTDKLHSHKETSNWKETSKWTEKLHEACKSGDLPSVIVAVIHMANISEGLYTACKNNHMEIIEYLLVQNNGDYKGLNKGLKGAYDGGHLEIAKLMLEKGANPLAANIRRLFLNNNPDPKIVRFMVENGSSYNANILLNRSCTKGMLDIAKLMVEKGATRFDTGLRHNINGCQNEGIINLMVTSGAHADRDINLLANANYLNPYILYCKHNNISPSVYMKSEKYGEVIKNYPPYIILLGKSIRRNGHSSKEGIKMLPVELIRLLSDFLVQHNN